MDKYTVRQLNSMMEAYPKSPDMQNDRGITAIVARRQPSLLIYANKKYLDDKEIASLAVKTDGQSLRFFSDGIRGDEEIVFLAVESFCKSFAFAVGPARKSKRIALSVARRGGDTISLLDHVFLSDKEVAEAAISRNPKALAYFTEAVRSNAELCIKAMSLDRTAVEFVADGAFRNKTVFERAVLDYGGRIRSGSISNSTPQGVFDEIERRELKFSIAAQKLDLMSVDRDKLAVCLKFGEGAISKKTDLLRKYIASEDKEIVSLIIERGGISQKALVEEVKLASKSSKIRVLPLLLKYTAGVGAKDARDKDERMYEMRSLRRKSPVAVQRFKENYQKHLADRELVLLAAYADGSVIKTLAHTEYICDEAFVTECLKSYTVKNSDGAILEGLNVDLTESQAELACSRDGRNYFFLPEKYKANPRICAVAVRSFDGVYDTLSDGLKKQVDAIMREKLWIR